MDIFKFIKHRNPITLARADLLRGEKIKSNI